jgi:polar amino acid transport system permease protein
MLQRAKVLGAASFRYFEPLTLIGIIFLVLSLLSAGLISKLEKYTREPA